MTGAPGLVSTSVCIRIGETEDGTLAAEIRFADGSVLSDERDLGLTDTDHALHDVAHALLSLACGLPGSPVLHRVIEARSLSQRDVDLEEAATFALQAWCSSLKGEDPAPALAMAKVSLDRLADDTDTDEPEDDDDDGEDFTFPVLLTSVDRHHGTVVTFNGITDNGTKVTVAFDHRPASEIAEVMFTSGPVTVRCTGWQIVRRAA